MGGVCGKMVMGYILRVWSIACGKMGCIYGGGMMMMRGEWMDGSLVLYTHNGRT